MTSKRASRAGDAGTHAAGDSKSGQPKRSRGRPRREINFDAVADAVKRLFDTGGYPSVTIENTAKELSVSRATLYRTVTSKEYLLAILFERMNTELMDTAVGIMDDPDRSPRDRLVGLLHAQIEAALYHRRYLVVFFGGGWLPSEFLDRWRSWRRDYEKIWERAIADAMDSGDLVEDDVKVTMRLLTGMTTWVARWYNPAEGLTADDITKSTLNLVLRGSK